MIRPLRRAHRIVAGALFTLLPVALVLAWLMAPDWPVAAPVVETPLQAPLGETHP